MRTSWISFAVAGLALAAANGAAAQVRPVEAPDFEALADAAGDEITQALGTLSAPWVEGEFLVFGNAARGTSPLAQAQLDRLGLSLQSVSPDAPFDLLRGAALATGPMRAAGGPLERASKNFLRFTDAVPDDPRTDELWMVKAIQADKAWAVHHDASDVIVAVIDDGVFLDHEDLKENIWTNPDEIPGNGVDDDGNGYIDDVHGWDFGDNDADPNPALSCSDLYGDAGQHGTHVAGTIGAVGGNGIGVIGVAPKVQIMALKVARGDQCASFPNSGILAAVVYAAKNGAKVINMSLGGPGRSVVAEAIYKSLGADGPLVVAAAGNDGRDNDAEQPQIALRIGWTHMGVSLLEQGWAPSFPASHELSNLLGVAATEPAQDGSAAQFLTSWWGDAFQVEADGVRFTLDGDVDVGEIRITPLAPEKQAIGSNYGATRVHIGAPGRSILSSTPRTVDGAMVSSYTTFQGTSMATPVVSGAAALLFSAFPSMTAAEVKARLMATVDRAPSLEGRVASGGQVNVYRALCAAGAPRRLGGCEGGSGGDLGAAATDAGLEAGQDAMEAETGAEAGETPERPKSLTDLLR